MTAITVAFTGIGATATAPDKPLDTALMTALKDRTQFLYEWVGASYTAGAVQDHNHDGSNSAAIETGLAVKNGGFESGTNGWNLTPFTGGSLATNTANAQEATTCLAITSTVLANGGGEAIMGGFTAVANALRPLAFTVAVKASVANVSSKAEVVWYDSAQAQISISTIYSSTNTPTTGTLQEATITPPSTAKFWKIKLTGGIPASGTATGTVYFDSVSAAPAVTYSGALVETGALVLRNWTLVCGVTVEVAPPSTQVDLGGNYVAEGSRISSSGFASNGGTVTQYVRGYKLKSN